ncbi:MAG: nicotinate (nicotinamide) nucleotide adenylyltransferase [Candidatus Eremiobacteraeota bacterium]|nr:nicotinate (nicotinamide) nucleotide adenylyltransferase [Candidatus Eremiobacteraeota bacterium]
MSRVLLFGGSFNPVHHGHLRLAVEALEQHDFDKVWLLPSGTPPHRQAYAQEPEHRARMLELAVADHPRLEVCRYELESSEVNYTYATVHQLTRLHPDHRFSFLTGLDVVYDYKWRNFEELLETLEHFLVASRPGYEFPQLLEKLTGTRHLTKLSELRVPLHQVSSSLIRERLQQGRSIHYWVPEPVRVYIENQGIYSSSL